MSTMTEEKEKVNRPLDTMDEVAYLELQTHYREAERTIKNLETRLAELLEIDESHKKLNGKLQERLTEVEQERIELHADNIKLSRQIEDQVNKLRKSGM